MLSSLQAIDLARFIVHTFRLSDEEVQKLHAPFVAFGVLDLVEVRVVFKSVVSAPWLIPLRRNRPAEIEALLTRPSWRRS